jgi:hypothetical protein
MIYFAPEAEEQYTAAGLRPGRMGYFASRSAAMGAVTPGVTAATFYNFNPELVARHLPRAWTLTTPTELLAARLRAADLSLRRLLGEAIDSPELSEAANLAREATTALQPAGRPLYAAHADLPWPTEPHLVLWHSATLLREYRGDGHLAALLGAGLSGVDAIVTHTATGRGFTLESAKLLRGWSDEQWAAAEDDLKSDGVLDDEGLTDAGNAMRERIESETDRMDSAGWLHLGPERTDRIIQLGKSLSRRVVSAGAFPPGVLERAATR